MEEEIDFAFFPLHQVSYHIHSTLECAENHRYVQDIIGVITRLNEDDRTYITVGQLSAYKVLLGVAAESGWDAFSIFDVHQNTMEVGEHIYDFKNETWDEIISKHYNHDIIDGDALILSRIEILPAYRGEGIGAKAIKDLYNNFHQGYALFALKSFPLQSEARLGERTDPFEVSMCYEKMEIDYKKASRKLIAYYN